MLTKDDVRHFSQQKNKFYASLPFSFVCLSITPFGFSSLYSYRVRKMATIEFEVDTIPRKSSFTRSIDEVRLRANSNVDVLAVDFNTLISSVVPLSVNNNDENDEDIPLFSSRKVYKNLIIISLAFILLFTAYSGIASLQSSLNTKGNVGVNSLIVSTVFTLVSICKILFQNRKKSFYLS